MAIYKGSTEPKKIYMYQEPYTDYSAMRGPCPEGFHIPTKAQWVEVYNDWTTLGGGNRDATNFGIALKLPFAGYRDYDMTVKVVGSTGFYWTCEANNNSPTASYALNFSIIGSGNISTGNSYYRAVGYPIRAFKDMSVKPTASWTKMYGTSIESGGIFWDSVNGLISISGDGSIWITIADKNLGATAVYSYGASLTQANSGNFYQWGNNYGFPFTGPTTTSTTQVNASTYGPNNYYTSGTFIKQNVDWSSSRNDNLWGNTTNTDVARKGPCDNGFHIPTLSNFQTLYSVMSSLSLGSYVNISRYLKFPLSGYCNWYSSNVEGSGGYYWTSNIGVAEVAQATWYVIAGPTNQDYPRSGGASIRPFKNDGVQPDDGWEVIYQ